MHWALRDTMLTTCPPAVWLCADDDLEAAARSLVAHAAGGQAQGGDSEQHEGVEGGAEAEQEVWGEGGGGEDKGAGPGAPGSGRGSSRRGRGGGGGAGARGGLLVVPPRFKLRQLPSSFRYYEEEAGPSV